jgi:nucleotide-binding universal stress UspA family protein
VKAELLKRPPGLRSSVEAAVTQLSAMNDLVAQRARFADLVVLPRPYGEGKGAESEAVIEAAMFEGKAPVLVLPEKGLGEHVVPKRIVVAWNQSAEAMTATRMALPFLKSADAVDITVIDPPPHGAERSDPGGLLCQMLVRHGVHAEVTVLARSLPRVSDVLARHVLDENADMLVMGAYEHMGLRALFTGSATKHLLRRAPCAIFAAH